MKWFFIKTTTEQTGKGDQSNTINFESISQGKKSKILVDWQQAGVVPVPSSAPTGKLR